MSISTASTSEGAERGAWATRPAVTNQRRGELRRWTRTLIPTLREAPAEAEAPSHRLLTRGGFIRRVGAGLYDYLPLGYRVIRRISDIVREEMDAAGAAELNLPALLPTELLKETGRADEYGDLLFRFDDRHGRDSYLGPTHEEVITELMRGTVESYKQLPLNVYQIQTKYRDEFRPRAGLLRCREFLMKDAYSFHTAIEGPGGLNETYDAMHAAYTRVFERCGLDFGPVEAEAGPIGGSASHEFMVFCGTGEDRIMRCPASGYLANVEKCEIGERGWSFDGEPTGELETVPTPNCPGIEDVAKLCKVKPRNMLKSVVFESAAEESEYEFIVAVVRGDQEVNEGKVRDAAGAPVRLADEKRARDAGFEIGYVSPRAAVRAERTLLLVDPDAAQGVDAAKGKPAFWMTGSDRKDHHDKHFNWRRDVGDAVDDGSRVRVADVRNAVAGDPSPRVEGVELEEVRGIEVGHIFKLGTKYSEAMRYAVMTEAQERSAVIMGCYGIGVSRTMAAAVEMSHDEDGIIWPMALAPYHVLITVMKPGDDRAERVAETVATDLSMRGFDVLIDDRDERPGAKFKDADLIGVPIRLTIGDKALDQESVEFKRRSEGGKGELVKIGDVVGACVKAADGVPS